jgi:nucleoside 2-deoxyribosyltransferase
MEKCIICGNDECGKSRISLKKSAYECKYCGTYEIFDIVIDDIHTAKNNDLLHKFNNQNLLKNNLYKIQSYIREQNDEFNNIPELSREKIQQIINLPDKTIKEQFNLFLLNLYKDNWNNDLEILRIKSWIKDLEILYKIAKKANEKKFTNIGFVMGGNNFIFHEKLTFDGISYVESLQQPNQNSKKIFLAFKFNDKNKTIFNNLADQIRELELNPIIVNQYITGHNEKIGDKIISELKSSKILIADLTEHSQNVYYEIGYAMGMGIPVILTCKKNEIDNLAFDINQYPVFDWKDEKELVEKVINRIKVII